MQPFFPSLYLSKVVKVVFVVDPSIVDSQTVRFISDVLHIQTHTIIELSFEELERKTHIEKRNTERQKKNPVWWSCDKTLVYTTTSLIQLLNYLVISICNEHVDGAQLKTVKALDINNGFPLCQRKDVFNPHSYSTHG